MILNPTRRDASPSPRGDVLAVMARIRPCGIAPGERAPTGRRRAAHRISRPKPAAFLLGPESGPAGSQNARPPDGSRCLHHGHKPRRLSFTIPGRTSRPTGPDHREKAICNYTASVRSRRPKPDPFPLCGQRAMPEANPAGVGKPLHAGREWSVDGNESCRNRRRPNGMKSTQP